jgi:outer membrane receptor protein involved in Fe transport
MNFPFKQLLSFIALFILTNFANAQGSSKAIIIGKVVASESNQAVMFATVMVGDAKTQKPIDGTTTSENGSFSISVALPDSFYVQVSFIGFTTKTINNLKVTNGKVDLGTIQLKSTANELDEVNVVADRSQTEFKLDKRVFNVGQDLSSTGASAVDVLNNVPSVNVNIEGQISLRGSQGVQILINGKPSILASDGGNALGTITADMIDKIEVITNPSAKYDAEGTSGIINIVLKKEEKKGLNGSISLNTGIPDNHSIGISLNRRTEKFNLFTQLGAGYRSMPRNNEDINQNLLNNSSIRSEGTDYRNEAFYNITLGTDYHINDKNVITLSGNLAYEVEDQPSKTNFKSYENGLLVSQWYRDETTEATNPKWQYELQYQREFKDNKEHTFLFSALGRFFGKDQSSVFENVTTFGPAVDPFQKTQTDFSEANYTFKADYSKPINDKFSFETGAQYVISDVSNDYAVFDFVDNGYIPDSSLTNLFNYNQKVLGVYGTASYEKDKWGVKAGLRAENTDLTTLLTNTNETNTQDYTNLFPTLHVSYKVTETFSLQAGYSKRIYRPRLWDLNPFFNIRNNFSIRTGNPNLQPEFTDSYEVTSIFIQEKYSLNFGVFHRRTTEVIERISTFQDNVNVVTPMNVGTNQSTGLELNAKYNLSKKVTLQGDANYNFFKRVGAFQGTSFDLNGDQFSSKITTKFKLPYNIDFEITGNYRSAFKTVQSTVSQNVFMDLGLRKKILKGKAVVSASVRDVFASRFQENIIEQADYYIYSYGLRGRFITLGLSYGFGKGEAMEYSGSRRR